MSIESSEEEASDEYVADENEILTDDSDIENEKPTQKKRTARKQKKNEMPSTSKLEEKRGM